MESLRPLDAIADAELRLRTVAVARAAGAYDCCGAEGVDQCQCLAGLSPAVVASRSQQEGRPRLELMPPPDAAPVGAGTGHCRNCGAALPHAAQCQH